MQKCSDDTNEPWCGTTATAVLVPGLFTPPVLMQFMSRQLKARGFNTLVIRNRSLRRTPRQNARQLLNTLQLLDDGVVHLVGHSLGGIVILHALAMNESLPVCARFAKGRVVLIATPVHGSQAAKKLYSHRWTRHLLGKSVESGLLGDVPLPASHLQLGLIRGTRRRGLAAALYNPDEMNDGVVTVAETEVDGATDTVCIPQSHALMLFSRRCADKVASFLVAGKFTS